MLVGMPSVVELALKAFERPTPADGTGIAADGEVLRETERHRRDRDEKLETID
jgi:hypothetical protein